MARVKKNTMTIEAFAYLHTNATNSKQLNYSRKQVNKQLNHSQAKISYRKAIKYATSFNFSVNKRFLSFFNLVPVKFSCKMYLLRYSAAKQSIANKSPKQKWQIIVDFTSFVLKIAGLSFLTEDRIYWWSYSSGLTLFIYFILAPYSVIYHIHRGDLSSALNPVCILGVCISVGRFSCDFR